MIVEFFGVSGSGKTTLAKQYMHKTESDGIRVIWRTYELYLKNNWLIRNIKKAVVVELYSLRNREWVKRYATFIRKEIKGKKDYLTMLFNGVYLKSIYHDSDSPDEVFLYDEGILQLLWSVKLRSKVPIAVEDLSELLDLFRTPNQVFVIDSEAETIAKRISDRGEYVRMMDGGDLVETIIRMQKTQNEIVDIISNDVTVVHIHN